MIRNKKDKHCSIHYHKKSLMILILCIGVGLALLSSQLQINGTTRLIGSSWEIYLENVNISNGCVEASQAPTIDANQTRVDFSLRLQNPGDFYEFTVDAVNDGTVDALVESVVKTSLDENTARFLTYTVTYANNSPIKDDDILRAKQSTTYKVRVEFLKDVVDSDLSENDINMNLSFNINYVPINSKIDRTFVAMAKRSATSDSQINFNKNSFITNGNGLFVVDSTKNSDNPIYYYRGDVNNNVVFAGYCWKIVRSTETGGTKLLYNGPKSYTYENVRRIDEADYIIVSNSEDHAFTFDGESKTWTSVSTKNIELTDEAVSFSVSEAGDYFLNITTPTRTDSMTANIYKDGNYLSSYVFSDMTEKKIYLYGLTTTSVITIEYSKLGGGSAYSEDSLSFSVDKGVDGVLGCDNKGERSIIGYSSYNENINSLSYVGYMHGNGYSVNSQSVDEVEVVHGESVTYSNGTYSLVNTTTDALTSENSEYHYTCFNSSTSCNTVYYVYKVQGTDEYYVELTNGKMISDVINEMNANTASSTLKTAVDTWFQNNIVTYFTGLSKDYKKYVEDTVWCNDRSMNTLGLDTTVYNGWLSTDSNVENDLYYSSYGRRATGAPSVTCPNKNDSFTVSDTVHGNAKLTYPVGLLTTDEIVLAGGQNAVNYDYYLYSDMSFWTMSPRSFSDHIDIHYVNANGAISSNGNMVGIRPSISIAPGIKISKTGNGTVLNPYEFIIR